LLFEIVADYRRLSAALAAGCAGRGVGLPAEVIRWPLVGNRWFTSAAYSRLPVAARGGVAASPAKGG
jgi:hypothetical protein